MLMNGAQALVKLLEGEGVPAVFGVVGGKLAPLLNALSQSQPPSGSQAGSQPASLPRSQARSPAASGIGFVGLRHEATGPMMAAAVHAATGQVAVAMGEMGPGGLNLAAGAGVAFKNNLAALLITTNQHRAAAYPHAGMFMDMDTHALMKPLTKWNAVVHDVRRLPELVRTAFREARSGRPGPVHLDIPQDLLAAQADWPDEEFEATPGRYRPLNGPRPAASDVRAAADLLRAARRPLIVAGGGAVASQAGPALRQLAAQLRAPVVPTQMGLGLVASASPHFIGHGGLIAGDAVRAAFEGADVILSVGCRFSSWLWDQQGPFARRRHRLINVNIDPSALGAPAWHEVAMQADARLALDDLLAELSDSPETQAGRLVTGDKRDAGSEADWLPRLRRCRADYVDRLHQLAAEAGDVMHPAALAMAIGEALPAQALAVFDGGHTSFWSNDLTPVQQERTRFHDPGMCQLGFGLPYAMALQWLNPGRAVLNITGDGSFGFTLQELDSARRHGLPVINIIHNNEAWGVIRAGQRQQGFEFGTSLAGTDYAAIARGFGCHGETVLDAAQVGPALQRALASGLPAVLDCRTRFVPHPTMPAFGSMNRYGFEALARS